MLYKKKCRLESSRNSRGRSFVMTDARIFRWGFTYAAADFTLMRSIVSSLSEMRSSLCFICAFRTMHFAAPCYVTHDHCVASKIDTSRGNARSRPALPVITSVPRYVRVAFIITRPNSQCLIARKSLQQRRPFGCLTRVLDFSYPRWE